MTAKTLLAELHAAGIAVQVHAGRLKLDAPRGALTDSVLSAVRDSKVELLKLLEPTDVAPTLGAALFHRGPGAGEQLPAGARTAPDGPEYSTTQAPSKADIEWDRFLAVAVPMPGGGLRDPGECSAELDRQIRVGGVSGEDWDSFIDDCGRLGKAVRTWKANG